MAEFVEYEIWLGTFEGENFVWKVIKKFNEFDAAYSFYHDYVMKQSKYDDEELKKVWSSGRIDVELRQGKKLINWAGLFSRRVADPEFDPYKAEKKAKKKAEPSDSEEKEGASPKTEYIASIGPHQGSDYTMAEEKIFSDYASAHKAYLEMLERAKADPEHKLACSLDRFVNDEHDEELMSYNIWEDE